MFCDHCGDCYKLLTDVRVLNKLANLFGGKWTVGVCRVWACGVVSGALARTSRLISIF